QLQALEKRHEDDDGQKKDRGELEYVHAGSAGEGVSGCASTGLVQRRARERGFSRARARTAMWR
ncbi:MAG TPA: hypothetical protein VD867_09770, partial [Burkholderiales bacterium]|nr:hypothetical protein [Burkholderiales bacterium]